MSNQQVKVRESFIDTLVERIRELEAENEQLNKKLDQVTLRHDEMQELYCEYHDVNVELKKALAKLEAENAALKRDLAEAMEKY